MKVIFLDIDGVLAIFKTWMLYGSVFSNTPSVKNKLDPYGVEFIKLLELMGVKIVLSSTWRKGKTLAKLRKILGINLHDKTCEHPFTGSVRGDEIHIWLKDNPQVTQFCIIDDDSDMLPYQMAHHVKTAYADGITHECMLKVCGILGIDPKSLRDVRTTK